MAEYTREQLIDGLNRAAAAGDNAAANEIAAMLNKMEEPETATEPMFPKFAEAAQVTGERLSGLMPTPGQRQPGVPTIGAEIAGGAGRLITGAAQDITPDVVEQAVAEGLEGATDFAKIQLAPIIRLGTILGESDIAQDVLNTIQESYSTHLSRKESDPEYAAVARELESSIDIAALLLPGGRFKPVRAEDTFLTGKGMDLIRSGRSQKIGDRKSLTRYALSPLDGFGKGRTTTKGWLKRKTYEPDSDELEMINVISSIPEFDPKATFTNNFNIIEDYIGRQANQLTAGITRAGNPEIDVEALIADIRTRAMNGLADEVYDRKGKARKIEQQLQLFRERLGKGTALEVLEARKALDRSLRKDSRSADDSIATPSKAGRRAISEAAHEAIAAAVPDVAVQDLLRKQALSYRALDIVDEKRRLEADTAIGRLGQNISRTGVNLPRNPASQLATGYAAGNIMQSGVFPYVLGTGATAASLYGLGKAVMSSQTKKFLGNLLVSTDKAIKAAKGSPEMIQQLKADRAVLVSLMQDARFDETEEGEEE